MFAKITGFRFGISVWWYTRHHIQRKKKNYTSKFIWVFRLKLKRWPLFANIHIWKNAIIVIMKHIQGVIIVLWPLTAQQTPCVNFSLNPFLCAEVDGQMECSHSHSYRGSQNCSSPIKSFSSFAYMVVGVGAGMHPNWKASTTHLLRVGELPLTDCLMPISASLSLSTCIPHHKCFNDSWWNCNNSFSSPFSHVMYYR